METRLENEMETMALQSIYRDMGIMEKKMETTSGTTLYSIGVYWDRVFWGSVH